MKKLRVKKKERVKKNRITNFKNYDFYKFI